MSSMPMLLLGTTNRGKLAEFATLLEPAGLGWTSLGELADVPEVDEIGATPAENAALKASVYAAQFGLWTLADDTVLSIAALHGAPGLHTARYAGPLATAEQNRAKLLRELDGLPPERARRRSLAISASPNRAEPFARRPWALVKAGCGPNLPGAAVSVMTPFLRSSNIAARWRNWGRQRRRRSVIAAERWSDWCRNYARSSSATKKSAHRRGSPERGASAP